MTKRSIKKPADWQRSCCPVSSALDLIGDKWSLLVIRDLMCGKRTYGELLGSPEGIPTNILADRLKRLEEAGLIEAKAYQERPVRYAYSLTRCGLDLREPLAGLARWGNRHIPGTVRPPQVDADSPSDRKTRTDRKAGKTGAV